MTKLLKIIVIIFSALILLSVGSHYYFLLKNTAETKNYLKKFKVLPYTNTFVTSQEKFYLPQKPLRRLVLLFHGYSASPEEFLSLLPALEKAHIPYYAPQFNGFGINDLHLLSVIKPSDWMRDAFFAYDMAARLADEVDVVGISTGGLLALLLAEHRKINTLILIGPNVVPSKADVFYKELLDTPILNQLVLYSYPVFVKPIRPGRITNTDILNHQAAQAAFHYPALPTQSLATTWQLQDQINLKKIHYRKLFLLYGRYDSTVNIHQIKNEFNHAALSYQSIEYPKSAHSILEDNDYPQAVKDIVTILSLPINKKT